MVVIAEKLPPSVRGKLKLWMIEPMPNIFISGVSDSLAEKVAERLFDSCPKGANMMIVRSKRGGTGYILSQKSQDSNCRIVEITGLQLVADRDRRGNVK